MSDYLISETGLGASVGEVSLPQLVDFDSLPLDVGETLRPITIAYETYGRLNEERTNAILVLHALSGDSHAAGYYPGESKPGWWETMGTARVRHRRYFIICSNVIGDARTALTQQHQPATSKECSMTPHYSGQWCGREVAR